MNIPHMDLRETSSKNPWQIEALTRRDSDRPGCFGDCEALALGSSEQYFISAWLVVGCLI